MTFAATKIDYSLIPVIDVAKELLGQESGVRSTATEKHFPEQGGLFVNIKKNRWYSHGNGTGGDAISLIRFVNSCDFAGAFDWGAVCNLLRDAEILITSKESLAKLAAACGLPFVPLASHGSEMHRLCTALSYPFEPLPEETDFDCLCARAAEVLARRALSIANR